MGGRAGRGGREKGGGVGRAGRCRTAPPWESSSAHGHMVASDLPRHSESLRVAPSR